MCVLTVLSQSRAWVSHTPEDSEHCRTVTSPVGAWASPGWHVGGLPVLWIKIECSGPEFFLLKAHLSSKSLTLFLLNEGGGNWTRTVRGRLNEGGDAAAGMCDAAPSWRPQVK